MKLNNIEYYIVDYTCPFRNDGVKITSNYCRNCSFHNDYGGCDDNYWIDCEKMDKKFLTILHREKKLERICK